MQHSNVCCGPLLQNMGPKQKNLKVADVKAKFSAWSDIHCILFVMSLAIRAVVYARLKQNTTTESTSAGASLA